VVGRILSIADDLEGAGPRSKLRWFREILLLHVAVRALPAGAGTLDVALAVCLLACFGLAWFDRAPRLAAGVAAALFGTRLAMIFPETPNHGLLELACLLLVAGCDLDDADERRLLGNSLRWMTAIVLFQSGLQKVLYGTWFDGRFLGYMIAADERFASAFGWLLSAEEMTRLRGFAALDEGAGPFRVDSLPLVLACNATYVFEMAAPVLLLLRRTRTAAAVATMAFIALIEAAAREYLFGLLFLDLLLLFPAGDWNRRAFPFFAMSYLVLAAAGLHLVDVGFFN
jgi:hypothetical protein